MRSDKHYLLEGWVTHFGGSTHLDPMSSTPSLTDAEAQVLEEKYPLAGTHLLLHTPDPAVSEPSTPEALFEGLTATTLSMLDRQGRAAQERRRRCRSPPPNTGETTPQHHGRPAHRGGSSAPAKALVSRDTTSTSQPHSRHQAAWRPTISSPLRQQVSPGGAATNPQIGAQVLPPAPQPVTELAAQLIANTLAFYATHRHPRPLGSNPPGRTQRTGEFRTLTGLGSRQPQRQTRYHPPARSQPSVSDGRETRHAPRAPAAAGRSGADVSDASRGGLKRGRELCGRGKRVVRKFFGGCM